MAIFIVGQAIFQLSVLFGLLWASKGTSRAFFFQSLTGSPDTLGFLGVSDEPDDLTRNTIVFNTFVFCQLFNEINCRRLEGNPLWFSEFLIFFQTPTSSGVSSTTSCLLSYSSFPFLSKFLWCNFLDLLPRPFPWMPLNGSSALASALWHLFGVYFFSTTFFPCLFFLRHSRVVLGKILRSFSVDPLPEPPSPAAMSPERTRAAKIGWASARKVMTQVHVVNALKEKPHLISTIHRTRHESTKLV